MIFIYFLFFHDTHQVLQENKTGKQKRKKKAGISKIIIPADPMGILKNVMHVAASIRLHCFKGARIKFFKASAL
jgi:hypothetical protein